MYTSKDIADTLYQAFQMYYKDDEYDFKYHPVPIVCGKHIKYISETKQIDYDDSNEDSKWLFVIICQAHHDIIMSDKEFKDVTRDDVVVSAYITDQDGIVIDYKGPLYKIEKFINDHLSPRLIDFLLEKIRKEIFLWI